MSATMSVRLEPGLEQRPDRLAQATQRSKSSLAAQAIRDFGDPNEWQVQEIRNAIAEADQGDLASEEGVKEVLGKWGVDAGWGARR